MLATADKFEMNAERNEDFKKFQKDHPNVYDYRYDGYWRIAQTFQHRNAHDAQVENFSSDMCFMRTAATGDVCPRVGAHTAPCA